MGRMTVTLLKGHVVKIYTRFQVSKVGYATANIPMKVMGRNVKWLHVHPDRQGKADSAFPYLPMQYVLQVLKSVSISNVRSVFRQ